MSLPSGQSEISEMQSFSAPWLQNTRWSWTVTTQKVTADSSASQRSLHNAPIFRLLLKVAVNGTHQCDFQNFCGALGPQRMICASAARCVAKLSGWDYAHAARNRELPRAQGRTMRRRLSPKREELRRKGVRRCAFGLGAKPNCRLYLHRITSIVIA